MSVVLRLEQYPGESKISLYVEWQQLVDLVHQHQLLKYRIFSKINQYNIVDLVKYLFYHPSLSL